MGDFLSEIDQRTRARVEALKREKPLAQLRDESGRRALHPPFAKALLKTGGLAVIAEMKQASPSAGVIRREPDVAGRVRGYARGGAAALSILTEKQFFHGSPEILELARRETTLPLLRKDFIVDAYQLEESYALGADAVLLITALLDDSRLKDFIQAAEGLSLDPLVEVHNEDEGDRALKAGARLVGVNNRNLRTLAVDPATAGRLVPRVAGEGRVIVVESGVREPRELPAYQRLGANAVLIGEALMRQSDAEAAVRSFCQGA